MKSETNDSGPAAQSCRNSAVAVEYWRQNAKRLGFKTGTDGVFLITLDNERRFVGCHQVTSPVFRSPLLFADEVVKMKELERIEEFVLIHNRPGISPIPGTDDKARAVELALAAHRKNSSLLDYVIVGDFGKFEDKRFPEGFFSSHKRLKRWIGGRKP